ncbi:gliding motility-associated C-terminal domain-containing protein [Myroides odoratus]|uniref:T9SS C-terminal target domain-containing protein n=1 Tax=Myroides odoratus TaxID=256 RepID=A0A9Q7E8P8_MYROD|nr:T9SS C-terminal target domain-containing protein [Myroides odoratus]EHQ43562.1 hypothetical protein Myrod_2741 [Myroides odoratus DSM 2801]EKB05897.1 hypothetical protein HMPREF9716_02606 [Myroides odoratus CIP 103059]QQU00886.1 T9SS C-terminal target domain-containing protein [Myroides odoratus]WQD56865.1 T9SS C-terminal target domain-containing protein [Myroides odoratus]STZ30839.1 gliding motility-associated C-terminal domain [Myroides odoratus]
MKKYVQVFVCFLVGVMPIFGQAPFQKAMVNQGTLTITPAAVVSTSYDFDNTASGVIKNDGTTYYYGNFNNDNLYYYNDQLPTAQAIFTPLEGTQGAQQITGDKPTDFYDVVFDNPTPIMGFDVKTEMNVKGSADFREGIVQVDSLAGMLTFHPGAKAMNPSDQSHVEGYVEKIGKENFVFPIGDKGVYRHATIAAIPSEKQAYQSKYILNDHEFFRQHDKMDRPIAALNTKEYWKLEKPNTAQGEILLTLSWDTRTTTPEVLTGDISNLHIVRWDDTRGMWVDQGGVISSDLQEVTTAVTGNGYFTLATVLPFSTEDNEVIIYNLVSPNGDEKNDYFYIENIQMYPNNQVEIYNRWGVKVYETTNYDSADNVFRGYSEGRVTINKDKALPTGTYFYIVTYEIKDKGGSHIVKKSGYLHLETE